MTDAGTLKIIITAISTGVVILIGKIVWDWLCKRKTECNDCDFKDDVIKIKVKLSDLIKKIDQLTKFITGDGDMEKSLAYRISTIESFMREIKTKKYSRGI